MTVLDDIIVTDHNTISVVDGNGSNLKVTEEQVTDYNIRQVSISAASEEQDFCIFLLVESLESENEVSCFEERSEHDETALNRKLGLPNQMFNTSFW